MVFKILNKLILLFFRKRFLLDRGYLGKQKTISKSTLIGAALFIIVLEQPYLDVKRKEYGITEGGIA